MMSSKTIRWLVLFSALSIIGVVVTQVYWIQRVLDVRNKQFSQQAHIALQEVAGELAKISNVMLFNNPVEQLGPDYFVVHTNARTQPDILEHFVKESFTKHNIISDFEVAIYNCTTNQMEHGIALSTKSDLRMEVTAVNWERSDKYPYYFGVHFPEKKSVMPGELEAWMWSTFIILIALAFFAYALVVIMKQRHLSKMQRDFINNMTHELQTPISSIRIAAEVLNNPTITQQPERYKRYTAIVSEEINRLQRQVEMVLTTSRAEHSKLVLQKETIDVHAALEHILFKYDKKVKQDFKADQHLINGDLIHFSALIGNLVDNALKYSTANPDVKVSTFNRYNKLVVSISDKGLGLAPEDQKKIFKKFYRVDSGDVHNVKGFGIGLSYVKEIVKAHRWKIELDSRLGLGSEFRIIINLA